MRMLLAALCCAALALGADAVRDPRGSVENRLRTLFNESQPRQFDVAYGAGDSLQFANEKDANSVWLYVTSDLATMYLCANPGGDSTFCIRATDLDWIVGNEVLGASDSTLSRTGSGTAADPKELKLDLTNPNTWTGLQTHSRINADTLRIVDDGEYTDIMGQTTSGPLEFKLPSDDGDNVDFLQTNGSGVLSWAPEADPIWLAWLDTARVQTIAAYAVGTVDGSGTSYDGGHYWFHSGNDDFSSPVTWPPIGAANNSAADHAFIVLGAQTVDQLTIRFSGTSIDDEANYNVSDTEDIVIPNGSAVNTYYETAKKWLGRTTAEVQSGTAKQCNYGRVKYWDNWNQDFTVTGIEGTWYGGATDTGVDLVLCYHKPTGWTYNAGAAPTPPTPLARLTTDHQTKNDVIDGYHGAWKRTDLNQLIDGDGSEGIIIQIDIGAASGKTFLRGNIHVRILEPMKWH